MQDRICSFDTRDAPLPLPIMMAEFSTDYRLRPRKEKEVNKMIVPVLLRRGYASKSPSLKGNENPRPEGSKAATAPNPKRTISCHFMPVRCLHVYLHKAGVVGPTPLPTAAAPGLSPAIGSPDSGNCLIR